MPHEQRCAGLGVGSGGVLWRPVHLTAYLHARQHQRRRHRHEHGRQEPCHRGRLLWQGAPAGGHIQPSVHRYREPAQARA
ncbi:ORF090L [Infectious spleen and kidney necrosis virus]|uniref:ORF090L n=2 Tax=Infectious spleen and kidney necrosis virus TaxID=180170 RepID=Q8QUL9_ISKNN|nr:ORF090L [Infectious spleen and kidney necrosis virus]AAL98814.1 ORF090L [Infectious spleen and kidney necrosis virus]AMM04496.1 ORF097L [Infectious spleen and kidney necrosis virus]QIQ54532.1 ORF088 [Angelfish iridovirus AFIV-16]